MKATAKPKLARVVRRTRAEVRGVRYQVIIEPIMLLLLSSTPKNLAMNTTNNLGSDCNQLREWCQPCSGNCRRPSSLAAHVATESFFGGVSLFYGKSRMLSRRE